MTAPGFPAPPAARRAVAGLAAIGFFLSMDLSLTNLLIEPVKRSLGLSDVSIGLLQGTAFGLALGVGALPLGWLVDRRPRVPLLRVGLVAWILAMAGSGLSPSLAGMLVARVVLGLVAALMVPAVMSLISDLVPPERRSVATSLFVVGQAAGQAFGIAGGGLALGLLARAGALTGFEPWRLTYLAAAAIGAVVLLALFGVGEPPRQEQREASTRTSAGIRELLGYRGFLVPLLVAMLLAQFTLQAATIWSAPALSRRFGLDPSAFTGWLAAVFLVSGIAGALAGGRLGKIGHRRRGPRGVIAPAILASILIVPAGLFGLVTDLRLFALLLAADILLNAAIATLGAIAIGLNVPNELRGTVLGLNSCLTALFTFATAPAAVALVSRGLGGEQQLGAAIAAVSVPAALLAAFGFWKASRDQAAALN